MKIIFIIPTFLLFALLLKGCCAFSSSPYCKRKELYESSPVCQRSETVCEEAKTTRRQYRDAGTPKDSYLRNLEIECSNAYKVCQEYLSDNSRSQDCCSDANYER